MKENICNIPIHDIFGETCGCPICRIEKMLEDIYVEYTTGPAMMAPDVRIITNKKGFCKKHFDLMAEKGPRLSNALILQTHLDEINRNLLPQNGRKTPTKAQQKGIGELMSSCYICDRIEHDTVHFLSTVFAEFCEDENFRKSYESQEFLCLSHYSLVMKCVKKHSKIKRAYKKEFITATNNLCKKYLESLVDDVTKFSKMYDYKNRGKDFGTSKDSIERSIDFLCGK